MPAVTALPPVQGPHRVADEDETSTPPVKSMRLLQTKLQDSAPETHMSSGNPDESNGPHPPPHPTLTAYPGECTFLHLGSYLSATVRMNL